MRSLMSKKSAQLIGLLILVQSLLLVIIPYAVSSAPPLDVVEGLVWAPHWLIGTYKHPPLPAWIIEISVFLTRDVILGPFIASQLCVGLAYHFIYRLGRLIFDPVRAAAGTILIAASYYFTVPTIEFNHNTIQLPLWACTIYLYALIRREPKSLFLWIALGALAGLSFYAKYSYAILLVTLIIATMIESSMRRIWLSPGPWLAMMICIVLIAPHVAWLSDNHFEPITYLSERADSRTASEPLLFLLTQILDHLPMVIPLLVAGLSVLKSSPQALINRSDKKFLRFVTFFPVSLVVVLALISSSKMKDMWGMAMFTPLGLLIIAEIGKEWSFAMLQRAAAASLSLITLVGIGFALHSYFIFGGQFPRTRWPMAELHEKAEALWTNVTDKPLMIIGGTPWIAGLAGNATMPRHDVVIGTNLDHSPWLTADEIETKGALFLFAGGRAEKMTLCSTPLPPQTFILSRPAAQKITAVICPPRS